MAIVIGEGKCVFASWADRLFSRSIQLDDEMECLIKNFTLGVNVFRVVVFEYLIIVRLLHASGIMGYCESFSVCFTFGKRNKMLFRTPLGIAFEIKKSMKNCGIKYA